MDSRVCSIRRQVLRGDSRRATLNFKGILRFDDHVCVLRIVDFI